MFSFPVVEAPCGDCWARLFPPCTVPDLFVLLFGPKKHLLLVRLFGALRGLFDCWVGSKLFPAFEAPDELSASRRGSELVHSFTSTGLLGKLLTPSLLVLLL